MDPTFASLNTIYQELNQQFLAFWLSNQNFLVITHGEQLNSLAQL